MGREYRYNWKKAIMIDKLWAWFTAQGYSGSVSFKNPDAPDFVNKRVFTCKANTPDDDIFIHEAIYEMDPDYRTIIVIKQVNGKPAEEWAQEQFPGGILEVSFEGDADDVQERLDDAILQGLAHTKVLKVRESGAIVQFGYKLEDLISRQ